MTLLHDEHIKKLPTPLKGTLYGSTVSYPIESINACSGEVIISIGSGIFRESIIICISEIKEIIDSDMIRHDSNWFYMERMAKCPTAYRAKLHYEKLKRRYLL